MSTNFYLYDTTALDAGVDPERLVGVHVAKRNFGGIDVGVTYTLQAVVNSTWKREWDYLNECPYWAPVYGFPAIKSWQDWSHLLNYDNSWTLVDEYGLRTPHAEFIEDVTNSERSAPHERHIQWVSDNVGRGGVSLRGHYLDDEGYSMCWWNFS